MFDKEIEKIINRTENEDKARALFDKIKNGFVLKFIILLINVIDRKMAIKRAVTNEFKYWFSDNHVCCIYLRPKKERVDIYIARLTPKQLRGRHKEISSLITIEYDDHNENDQFESRIVVDNQWLSINSDKVVDLVIYINSIIDDIHENGITERN